MAAHGKEDINRVLLLSIPQTRAFAAGAKKEDRDVQGLAFDNPAKRLRPARIEAGLSSR
jgi:hypothetical protein